MTYTAPLVGLQFNNGINAIIAYDPDCVRIDPYNNTNNPSGCLSMVYDLNGFAKPNRVNKDIKLFNVTKLGNVCAFELGGTCYGASFSPTALTYAQCEAQKSTLGINACCNTTDCPFGDFWAGAVAACGGKDKLPSQIQLKAIAQEIYPSGTWSGDRITGAVDNTKRSSYGLSSSPYLWSSSETSSANAYGFDFYSTYGEWAYDYRSHSSLKAICTLE